MKLLSRDEYNIYTKTIKDSCNFCDKNSQILIKEYKYFYWIVSISPYVKYHTLLIPKRHVEKYSDLNNEELMELKIITEEIKGRVLKLFEKYNQIFISIREAIDDTSYDTYKSKHLHIHFIPDTVGSFNFIKVEEDAKNYDLNVFINLMRS